MLYYFMDLDKIMLLQACIIQARLGCKEHDESFNKYEPAMMCQVLGQVLEIYPCARMSRSLLSRGLHSTGQQELSYGHNSM